MEQYLELMPYISFILCLIFYQFIRSCYVGNSAYIIDYAYDVLPIKYCNLLNKIGLYQIYDQN